MRFTFKLAGAVGLTLVLLSTAAKARSGENIWPCLERVRNRSKQHLIAVLTEDAAKHLADKISLPANETLRVHLKGSAEAAVELMVEPDGAVQCVRFKEGHPMLAADAISAASKWRFRPYIRDGKALPFRTTLRFRLVDHEFHLASFPAEGPL